MRLQELSAGPIADSDGVARFWVKKKPTGDDYSYLGRVSEKI